MGGVEGKIAHADAGADAAPAPELPVVEEATSDALTETKAQAEDAPASEPEPESESKSVLEPESKSVPEPKEQEQGLVQVEEPAEGGDAGEVGGEGGEVEVQDSAEPEPEAAEEEEDTSKKITIDDVRTAPPDLRFPTTNQTKHCYTRYNEFHKCQKDRGEGAPECEKYARWYRSLCPMEWIERWNEQRAEGVFPGPY